MNDFVWEPGKGFDEQALKRLQNNFTMPRSPMGEAWFMGEDRYYYNNLSGDLDDLSIDDLTSPLVEISSGTSSFGNLDEWAVWFRYLLAQLIPRNHEYYVDYLLEYLVTGFITQYPDGINTEPYKGFKGDVINTIGKCMMDICCWSDGKINIGKIMFRSNKNPSQVWGWWNASGELSASLFFCLKYLPVELIESWFESVMKISCPHWRAQLIVWLVGANDILCDRVQQPSQLNINVRPAIDWAESHMLSGNYSGNYEDILKPENFIPKENREMLLKVVSKYMSEDIYLQWLSSISKVDYLEFEIAEIPDTFIDIYLTDGNT